MGQFQAFIGVNFWDALFVLLNTLTIFFVAKKYLFRPVMKIIRDRQQEIDEIYTKANEAENRANALRGEYEQRSAAASREAQRLVKEAADRGRKREEEIIRQANDEADTIRSKAFADIAREKKKAINDAKDEISDMAMAIAGKVVGRALNDRDQAALVDHFINELGDQV